jgi:hypothetical protein
MSAARLVVREGRFYIDDPRVGALQGPLRAKTTEQALARLAEYARPLRRTPTPPNRLRRRAVGGTTEPAGIT